MRLIIGKNTVTDFDFIFHDNFLLCPVFRKGLHSLSWHSDLLRAAENYTHFLRYVRQCHTPFGRQVVCITAELTWLLTLRWRALPFTELKMDLGFIMTEEGILLSLVQKLHKFDIKREFERGVVRWSCTNRLWSAKVYTPHSESGVQWLKLQVKSIIALLLKASFFDKKSERIYKKSSEGFFSASDEAYSPRARTYRYCA